ncbi:hypothetical protein TIFTF001_004259 [Ficus carica]|uniref:Uncharacterized protein n=1 Tax=Ficus carica TaxID=3494 RepID=A0AA87ZFG7_FICCA|nr:hypothetical protein TIFTF001_004259 [Ficus carica]
MEITKIASSGGHRLALRQGSDVFDAVCTVKKERLRGGEIERKWAQEE